MAYSYTFHISSKKNAINNHNTLAGKVNKHNLRAYKAGEKNRYDRDKTIILAGNGKSIVEDVKAVYHREFDECLKRYNKGKRKDRVIRDYYDHISDSRSDLAVEIIIQVGDREFWGDKTPKEWEIHSIPLFKKQILHLEEICPEFKVASAAVHLDERDGSPHMHIVGVPVASGYKKGMEKQVAKTKVFTKTSLSTLQDKMRLHARSHMEEDEFFEGNTFKEKERGRNIDYPVALMPYYYQAEKQRKNAFNETIKRADLYAKAIIDEAKEMATEEANKEKEKLMEEIQREVDCEMEEIKKKASELDEKLTNETYEEAEKFKKYMEKSIEKDLLDLKEEKHRLEEKIKNLESKGATFELCINFITKWIAWFKKNNYLLTTEQKKVYEEIKPVADSVKAYTDSNEDDDYEDYEDYEEEYSGPKL